MTSRPIRAAALLLTALVAVTTTGAARADDGPHATILRTSYGVPHIFADDFTGLGYGYGYSFAQDNICEMADDYVTLSAERSKTFGPDKTVTSWANGVVATNLDSDFFYQRINDSHVVENLIAQAPPLGPVDGVKELVSGYVAGYNHYLDTKTITDPRCAGQAWVRKIDVLDAWRRFYQLSLFASQGALQNYIVAAQPPTPSAPIPYPQAALASKIVSSAWHGQGLPNSKNLQLGSNAVALGTNATDNGRGMLLANPHFPWVGTERFTEFQMTIPGRFNAEGAALFGVPLVLIGHTDNVAWSHTVSTAWRFSPYELHLVPGDPTSYIYDNAIEHMTPNTVTVTVKNANGSFSQAQHTFWETRFGPMMVGIGVGAGVNIFNWTPVVGYAVKDANIQLRSANQFFAMDQAQSVEQIKQDTDLYQGIPWVNTIAADSTGQAYYADHSIVPHVTNDQITRCVDSPVGLAVWQLARLPILDGSTSACAWGSDPDAVVPGIYGPSHLPILFRSDYTENSNDSYWLPNARLRLEGYPEIIGDERTQRSLRTRIGFIMIEDQLRNGGRFSLTDLQHLDWMNRQYGGELWLNDLETACTSNPAYASLADGCAALKGWDLHNDVGSKGAVLWQRFMQRALSTNTSPWVNQFDATDPVHTPNGLNTANPEVQQAFSNAIGDLKSANIPLDAPLGDYQYRVLPDGSHIPIHGGPGELGNFNAINSSHGFDANGYSDTNFGSSFMMTVQFTDGCPKAASMLSYSESTDPISPHYADQTTLFSAKQWKPMLYCWSEIEHDIQSETDL